MKHFARFALFAGLALGLAAQASGATKGTMNASTTPQHSMTIKLGAESGSNQTGQAILTDTSGGLKVKVQVKNEPAGASQPAHIHQGTCTHLNPAPWKPLSNVVKGMSLTTVKGVTLAELRKGQYAINVHKSANALKTYVSCGNI